jgi:4-hydroxybenzoate polyprenyltransferase
VLIVSYDAVLKRTWLGPLAMGGCRALNVLLGMAAAAVIAAETRVLGFSDAQLLVAGGLGLYVAGVTWFARTEARVSSRLALVCATLVMGGGIAVLGLVYRRLPPEVPVTLRQESTWLLLLGLLAFTIMRRCAIAVVEPEPRRVQLAVQHAIWSLIMLDAALVLLVCHPSWAVAIVLLLIPTIWLGRRVAST